MKVKSTLKCGFIDACHADSNIKIQKEKRHFLKKIEKRDIVSNIKIQKARIMKENVRHTIWDMSFCWLKKDCLLKKNLATVGLKSV
jgi:hypothetical protein